MKKRKGWSLLIAALVCLTVGCSEITMLRSGELLILQSHIDSLKTELTNLQNTMYAEQKNQGEIVRLIRADQQVRFNEIENKVSEIATNLNENQSRLSKIDEKTAEFHKKFEAKLTLDSLAENNRNEEMDKLFHICMSDFNAGRFDIAINGFKDLSVKFPESPLASEAEYWVAECYYAKHAYSQAEKEYISYVKKYPQGSKICVALYKLGLTYGKQGKDKSKAMVWKKALDQCPNAPEIQVIKSQQQ